MSAPSSYDERVRQQISQYEYVENMHELPPIFHYYSNKVLRPRLNEVMDADSMAEFFGRHLMAGFEANTRSGISRAPAFASLGCGDAWLEIEVAQYLMGQGMLNFTLSCLELSPVLAGRAKDAVQRAGLNERLKVELTDINRWNPEDSYDGIMAHHSLHHFVELEHIFTKVRSALKGEGTFVIADMIGRNGHMRWPETLGIIEMIWRNLAPEKRRNHQMRNAPEEFVNWDCSGEGFEGIRSQDIMPILLNTFKFQRVIGIGGLTDIFVDRAYGWNFDPTNPYDKTFIDLLIEVEYKLLGIGHIKPTQMLAVLGRAANETIRIVDGLTPEKIVRWPS